MTVVHSRKFGYLALTVAVLALEVVFAWRISLVYGELLQGQASAWEVWVLKWTIFLAVAVFGFVLATHRHYGVAAIRERVKHGVRRSVFGVFMAVVVVVAHDWGAAIYTVFGKNQAPNVGLVMVTIGMCGLVLVPFLIGRMAQVLAESLREEEAEGFERKKRQVEQRQALAALKRGPTEPGRALPAATRRSLWPRGTPAAARGVEEGGPAPLGGRQPVASS